MRPELVAEVGVRPRQRRAHPPRGEVAALARRPRPAVVHVRPARLRGVTRSRPAARAGPRRGAGPRRARGGRARRSRSRRRTPAPRGWGCGPAARAWWWRTWCAPATRSARWCGRGRCAGRSTCSAAEDVRWIVGLLGPVVVRKYARRRAGLGLGPDRCERILTAVPAVLDDGPLSRAELVDALNARGMGIDTAGPGAGARRAAGVGVRAHVPGAGPLGRRAHLRPARRLGGPRGAPGARRGPGRAGPALPRRVRAVRCGRPAVLERHARRRRPAGVGAGRSAAPGAAGEGAHRRRRLLPAFDGVLLGHRDRSPTWCARRTPPS